MTTVEDALPARGGLKSEATVFAGCFVVTLLVALLAGVKPFIYDAGVYWALADLFRQDGGWSLLNFSSELRGYVPALVFGGLREIAEVTGGGQMAASVTIKVFNSAMLAAIGTVLIPRLISVIWPQMKFGAKRRTLLGLMLLIFWRGYLNFPSTDISALFLAVLALLGIARATAPSLVLSGGAVAAAVSFRPAYLLLLVGAPLLASARRGAWTTRLTCGGAVLLGVLVVSIPQSLMHHRNFDIWSPLPGAPAKLTSQQLNFGLNLQRYDTFVGGGRPPTMNYRDPHTGALLAAAGRDRQVDGFSEYLRIAVHEPIEMAGVFGRHFINGLDQRYSTPYVERLDNGGQRPYRVIGALLVLVAMLRLGYSPFRRTFGQARWGYLTVFLLTCATTLPSGVEQRFLLPVFVMCAAVALLPGYRGHYTTLVSARGVGRWLRPLGILTASAVWAGLVLIVTNDATANLVLG